jgi:hypothetical protein
MPMGSDDIIVVYPQAGNTLYEVLGQRLATAWEENSRSATLCSASVVCGMDREALGGKLVMVVQPAQCYIGLAVPDREALSLRLSEAHHRVAVTAESVKITFFGNQFKIPARSTVPVVFDAAVDVGFISQADSLEGFETPYLFLFNGPTREEKRTIEQATTSVRRIPWALVGHDKGDRVELAYDLTREVDPGGAVFLPPSGVVIQKDNGMISPSGLHALLGRTRYYVWKSLHEFDYYESFRFREAVLAGAAPCKIDGSNFWEDSGIPGIFPSVSAFAEQATSGGYEPLLEQAKEFYLSQGLLADRLEEVLECV